MKLGEFDRMVEDFARAAVASEPAPRTRRWRRRGFVVPAVAAGLAMAGGTLAATGTVRIGDPVEVEPHPALPGADPPGHRITPGSVRLGAARAGDPDGGPPWGIRTFRTDDGDLCVQVGRVVGGRLGSLGFDGKFHELPVLARIAACAPNHRAARVKGVFPPRAEALDVNGMPRSQGCADGAVPYGSGSAAITPCDHNRFRYLNAGVLDRSVDRLRVRDRLASPAADGTFVYVLRAGDQRGLRVTQLANGRESRLVRAGNGWPVPTARVDRRAERVAGARVDPPTGDQAGTFELRWRVPKPARHRGDGWVYRLFGPGGGSCRSRLATAIYDSAGGSVRKEGELRPTNGIRRGQVVVRRIKPPGPPPLRWCPGDYRGEIRLNDKTIVGRFGFRVSP